MFCNSVAMTIRQGMLSMLLKDCSQQIGKDRAPMY